MNPRRFDQIAKLVATRWPRRTFLKAVVGSVAGGGFLHLKAARVSVQSTSAESMANLPALGDTAFTTASLRVCTATQDEVWNFARDFTHGVIGRDPLGNRIGWYPAYKSGGVFGPITDLAGRNWYPLAARKKTLCGRLHHFNFYDPWSSGDEADWNNYIIPSEQFAYLIRDALPMAGGNVHDCGDGRNNCMEAEVTPDEHHYGFYYFNKSTDRSPLEGRDLCTYGPWVREEAHGNRPEIHPSELYWWRQRVDRGPFNLLAIQDDSNRFDRRGNFAVPDNVTNWRPWSAPPRLAEFRVAFQANANTVDPWTFGLTQSARREVITGADPAASADSDDGRQHTLRYNGRALLHVVERQPVDADVGVRFVEVCRNAANTRVRGYIQLTTKMGINDRGKEGFTMLHLSKDELIEAVEDESSEANTVAGNLAAPMLLLQALPDSLRRETVDGRDQLRGDIAVRIDPGASFAAEDTTVARVALASSASIAGADSAEIELTFVPDAAAESAEATPVAAEGAESVRPASVTGKVLALPVSRNVPVEFTMASGAVVSTTSPGIFLAPRIATETPLSATADDAAWPNVATAVNASSVQATPSAHLQRVTKWHIDATPSYAPWRSDELALGDETPFTEALNELIEGDERDRLRDLFGVDAPFAVEWTFQATNVADGAIVAVNTGPAVAEAEIGVSPQPAPIGATGLTIPNASLDVTFPTKPEGAVFELLATATMTDVLGGTGEIRRSLWSHALTGEDEDALVESTLDAVAVLSGVPADAVVGGSRIDDVSSDDVSSDEQVVAFDDRDSDSQARRLQSVRMFAMASAADGLVTVGDLRTLVQGARLAEDGA